MTKTNFPWLAVRGGLSSLNTAAHKGILNNGRHLPGVSLTTGVIKNMKLSCLWYTF